MKVVILAGGLGTRISEETHLRPKPMIEIGGMPILWHIMKSYSHFGFCDFIICGGYKCQHIKEFFSQYFLQTSDVTFDFRNNKTRYLNSRTEDWTVTVVDTGASTLTGGRLKRVGHLLNDDEPFFFTYGDGLADVDFHAELDFHKNHSGTATVLSVIPPGRFGALEIHDNRVTSFIEKPNGDRTGRINGGFFILQKEVLDYIQGDQSPFENGPLSRLACEGKLHAFEHNGFWQPMDTLRDKNNLEKLWQENNAPWKVWNEEVRNTSNLSAQVIDYAFAGNK